jgi:hypothetical protein
LKIMVCLKMVAVKFMHYCYYSSNWNLDDFSNQGYTFVNMDYDLVFENCLKHWLVLGDISWKKAKLDNHWLGVYFHIFDTQFLE